MKQNVKSSVFPCQKFLDFNPILLNDKCVKVVESCKLLRMTLNNKLTWNSHIDEVVKKVSKRIYYLIQRKRANIPVKDLVLFYVTCIRSVMTMVFPSSTILCQNTLCSE